VARSPNRGEDTDHDGGMGPKPTTTTRWEPADEERHQAVRAELMERFAAWAAEAGHGADPNAPDLPLHYKWGYLDGHLTRWTCADVDALFLEVYPAKVIVDDDELGGALDDVRLLVAFLADTGLLAPGSDPAPVIDDHLTEIEGDFRAAMADPARGSFGKQLWSQAISDGVDLSDQAAIDAFIARFNAQPEPERRAALGLGGSRSPGGRITPPGTPPRRPSPGRSRATKKGRKRRH
jgi:hypothetical protein